jgi:hypothetical protein
MNEAEKLGYEYALDKSHQVNKRWEFAYDKLNDDLRKERRLRRKAQRNAREANVEHVYEDALRKMEWNMRRGKNDRVDYWCILAVTLEELYGVQRPEHLKENP